ncbi:MAG: TetR/AcrR family transcriptional regulator [Gemmatimonadota bacterium]|jgi:AcrR family transcriptional regulator
MNQPLMDRDRSRGRQDDGAPDRGDSRRPGHDSPGNPGAGDSGAPDRGTSTRDALVAASRALFARRGYDGTSIRAITTEAGANLGAVTYHFGSKRELYEEVLRTAVEPLGERVRRAAASESSPDGPGDAPDPGGPALERIAEVVRAFFRHLAENPDIPQLMLQEIAAGKDPPPPVLRTLPSMLATIAAVISEGQEGGRIREGDPRLLALSCIAQPLHLTLVKRWARRIADVRLEDDAERERIVEHAINFAVAGLRSRPGPRRKTHGPEKTP